MGSSRMQAAAQHIHYESGGSDHRLSLAMWLKMSIENARIVNRALACPNIPFEWNKRNERTQWKCKDYVTPWCCSRRTQHSNCDILSFCVTPIELATPNANTAPARMVVPAVSMASNAKNCEHVLSRHCSSTPTTNQLNNYEIVSTAFVAK